MAKEAAKNKQTGGTTGSYGVIIISVFVLVGVIVGCFLFFTQFGREIVGLRNDAVYSENNRLKGVPVRIPDNIHYYELPEMLVNIQASSGKRKPYLRLAIKLELREQDHVELLDKIKPRIIDSFQIYLRELRADDLEGAAGSQRLKEELLKRVNNIGTEVKVYDVLFQVFVVQ